MKTRPVPRSSKSEVGHPAFRQFKPESFKKQVRMEDTVDQKEPK